MAIYKILIQVDPHTGQFQYTDPITGQDQSNIPLVNGDGIVWLLDPSLPHRDFQIDFDDPNPFQAFTPVSFRGTDFVISSSIRLSPNYPVSKGCAFKYSVSLGNGWHDDPNCLIVPEPPYGHNLYRHHLLDGMKVKGQASTISAIFNVDWTDASETALSLTPNPVTATSTSPSNIAPVIWRWDPSQPLDRPAFTLQFLNPAPTGFTASIVSPQQGLALWIPKGGPYNFTVTAPQPYTTNNTTYSAKGTLTVN